MSPAQVPQVSSSSLSVATRSRPVSARSSWTGTTPVLPNVGVLDIPKCEHEGGKSLRQDLCTYRFRTRGSFKSRMLKRTLRKESQTYGSALTATFVECNPVALVSKDQQSVCRVAAFGGGFEWRS